MSFTSIGDLAQGFALRRQSTTLKQQMDHLSQELASGVTADVTRHLSGDFVQLADVEHKLPLLESYKRGADQGRVESSAMQVALGTVQSTIEELSHAGLLFGSTAGAGDIAGFAKEARATIGTLLSALNTQIGGRALFGGDAVTTAPMAPADDVLGAIRAAVAGATTPADMEAALDTFFDTPGGDFDTLIYRGGASARGPYQLGEGESVSLDLRADDPAFRAVLKQVALGAILDDPGVALTKAQQVALARELGETLLIGQTRITAIRSDLGFAEGRIDRAATRLAAESSSLGMLQADLRAIDPFETATELETVQLRLETLYTITSRMSRLNLVNYL